MIPQYHKMNKLTRIVVVFVPEDLVLVLEKKIRGQWPMARVTDVHETDRDGVAQSLTVEMSKKLMIKPVHEVLRLTIFDLNED